MCIPMLLYTQRKSEQLRRWAQPATAPDIWHRAVFQEIIAPEPLESRYAVQCRILVLKAPMGAGLRWLLQMAVPEQPSCSIPQASLKFSRENEGVSASSAFRVCSETRKLKEDAQTPGSVPSAQRQLCSTRLHQQPSFLLQVAVTEGGALTTATTNTDGSTL